MKLLTLFLLLLGPCLLTANDWHFGYVDTVAATQSDMAIDHDGVIHVVYYKETGWPWTSIYAVQDGSGWSTSEIMGSDGLHSIAVDANNQPHISVRVNGGQLLYTTSSASGWNTVKVDTADYFHHQSIAVDADGHIHISYVGGLFDHYLKYACFDGSSWTTQIVDSSGMVGDGNVLVIDNNNHPHILYGDGNHNTMKYCFYDGSAWQFTQFEMNNYHDGGMALDGNNYPHICYKNSNNDLAYMYFDGSSWHEQVVDPAPASGETAKYSSICLDSQGRPHIAFGKSSDWMHFYLYHAYSDGANWQVEAVDTTVGIQTSNAVPARIAVDGSDNLHIIYAVGDYPDRFIKYATTAAGTAIDPPGIQQPQDFVLRQNYPNPFNPGTVISYQLPAYGQVELAVYNLAGQRVSLLVRGEQPAGNYKIPFNAQALPAGIYFYRLQVHNGAEHYSVTKKMTLVK